jgi:hypothetical protein
MESAKNEADKPLTAHELGKICDVCTELNVVEHVSILECHQCGEVYCTHFASTVDPAFCNECVKDVQMEKSVITRTTDHVNSSNGTITTRKQSAIQIRFKGTDFLFHHRKIRTLSDIDLELAIEYHRATYATMIVERDLRQIEHFHRNSGKVVINTSPVNASQVTTTYTKKTTVTKSAVPNKKQINAIAALELLQSKGLSVADITAMMKRVK